MTRLRRDELRRLEGHRINLALADGSRIDDCELVAVDRGPDGQVWVHANGADAFVPLSQVADAWETARSSRG